MRPSASILLYGGVLAASLLFARQTRSALTCDACFPPRASDGVAPAAPGDIAVNTAGLRLHAREEEARERGMFMPMLIHGDPNLKEVALTFDDGPHPSWTPRLLDLLGTLKVHATFFLVGKMVMVQ